ncbi:glycosyltransferase [Herbaspirillum seropedicae]|uniref:glycosyltransferase n=1 Tax=Herbaspirillum seropedicae TaxID=964 RepID=UPI0031D52812
MNSPLSVAVPWSLSHYLPLNGFHPLYRALFEAKPEWVRLAAWDSIELSHRLRGDQRFQHEMMAEVQRDMEAKRRCATRIEQDYFAHFWAPNLSLTRLLPGDIEFHHTAPFPSLERPFVFHCESFAPIFFPFAHQGTGSLVATDDLRSHYKAIFEHPLCLGISSHLPQTLGDISRFFGSSLIDERLFSSRIGMHVDASVSRPVTKGPLDAPLFLFINSANQNRGNFFLRGGHLALRYWQALFPEPGAGRLIMRCARPIDALLADNGVDLDWLRRHERRSIIWIEDYLSADDLDALMRTAHVFLLPSASLHSVSIMQAMNAGAVPVVTDTLGTDRYVADDVDGIVLKGVYASNWHRDEKTGVMIDRYQRNPALDDSLVQQLLSRLGELLANPDRYASVQAAARAKAAEGFSGQAFSENFWSQVQQRYQALPTSARSAIAPRRQWQEISYCLLEQSDWARVFTSPPQPVARLHTGLGQVTELGGCFIALPGNCAVDLHDWSPLAEYVDSAAPPLIFAADIKGLGGRYLGCPTSEQGGSLRRRLVSYVAECLMPYPAVYTRAARVLKVLRRVHRAVNRYLPARVARARSAVATLSADIELVIQGLKGLNIIRCGHLFYAVPQGAGEFSQARAEAGKYSLCLSGTSLKDVLRKVEALPDQGPEDIELVEQDVQGFNIIRYGRMFYAIPMNDGTFDIARVQSGQYRSLFSGETVLAVRQAIHGDVS